MAISEFPNDSSRSLEALSEDSFLSSEKSNPSTTGSHFSYAPLIKCKIIQKEIGYF